MSLQNDSRRCGVYHHILIPLENSPTDETILDHVRPLAKMTGARITLIHVADGFVARHYRATNLAASQEMQDDQAYLDRVCAGLRGEGFDTQATLECGEPTEQILATAEREGCDLIAMSTHGHRFISDFIFGSVANEVRHRTDIPVLLVRAQKSEKASQPSKTSADQAYE